MPLAELLDLICREKPLLPGGFECGSKQVSELGVEVSIVALGGADPDVRQQVPHSLDAVVSL
jgi:hypothetical protein